MKYGEVTNAGRPTRALTYTKLCDHLREAQDCASLMAHLHNTEGNSMDALLAKGWLGIEELLKRLVYQVTELAKRNLNA